MRVLVIPDIHLKPWIFDRTEKILRDGCEFPYKSRVIPT